MREPYQSAWAREKTMETVDWRPRKTSFQQRGKILHSRGRVFVVTAVIYQDQFGKAVQNNINVLQTTLCLARRSFFTESHTLTKACFWGHSFFAPQHQESL